MSKVEELENLLFDTIKDFADINPEIYIEMDSDYSKGYIKIKVSE